MKYYIYKLTFKSGATYIGQHIERKEDDKYISSSLYMKRNPKDPIIKREILIYVKDKQTLDIMETLCIRADKAENPKNVNGNLGNWNFRFCFKGGHHSKKVRKEMSERMKKRWQDPEYKQRMIDKHVGQKRSAETKQKMSQSAICSWTEERKRKAVESGNYKHTLSEETKKNISKNNTGRIHINNGKEELSVKNPEDYIKNGWSIGKLPVTDETKKRMSESAKKRPCNTKGKKKIHKDDIGKFVSVEELDFWLSQGWESGLSDKRKGPKNK